MESRLTAKPRCALVLMVLAMTVPALAGCGRNPMTPTTPTAALAQPGASIHYQLSGRVTDETGQPVGGALVEVDHGWVPDSAATSHCYENRFCWVATRTNADGEYLLEFNAGPITRGNRINYLYAYADGYETDIQWMPAGSATMTRDLRLPRARPIAPGESTSVSVDSSSTLCSDLEDYWLPDQRCAIVRLESATAGTMTVDVLPRDGSGTPLLFWGTTGDYAGPPSRPSETTLSIPMRGGTCWIFIGIPESSPARTFDVVTSFR